MRIYSRIMTKSLEVCWVRERATRTENKSHEHSLCEFAGKISLYNHIYIYIYIYIYICVCVCVYVCVCACWLSFINNSTTTIYLYGKNQPNIVLFPGELYTIKNAYY